MNFRFLRNLLFAMLLSLMVCPIQVGCQGKSSESEDGKTRYQPRSPRIDKNKPTVVYSENDELADE